MKDMFNVNLGNAKVNGHLPGMAAKRSGNGNIRKALVTPHPDLSCSPQSNPASNPASNPPSASNGPLKFSDRLKVLLNNSGSEAGGDMVGSPDDSFTIKDDPYAFNEPETAVLHQYQNASATARANQRPSPKAVQKRSVSSSSGELTGLNMTRLFPAISTNAGHSFFSPNLQSPQSSTTAVHSDGKTTLASLLESSLLTDDSGPKSSSELERAFSFSSKELNCFPNLTSPQSQEQSTATPVINTSKVSPLTHGSPVTPQRESNKLAALFSPTYPNSSRADSKGRAVSKVGRANSRDGKNTLRNSQGDRRASLTGFEKSKDPVKLVDGNLVLRKAEDEDFSKTIGNRLQTKVPRNRPTGKHKKVDSIKSNTEIPQRRHSLNDVTPRKERTFLEEQLVSQKAAKVVKREPLSSSPPPVPAATTRVPGSLTLTPSASRSSHNASPNTARSSASSRQPKAQATYCSPKSWKGQAMVPSSKPSAAMAMPHVPKNASYNVRNNVASKLSMSSPSYQNSRSSGSNRAQKRPRVKQEMPDTSTKHEALQRLQPSPKSARGDPFVIPATIAETDNDDSDVEEGLVYQKHWFSGWREAGSGLAGEERREGRLSQLRAELRRKLRQVLASRRDPALSPLPTCVMDSAITKPSKTALLLRPKEKNHRMGRSKLSMLVERKCVYTNSEGEACTGVALPCARHCSRHIMYNVDQLLFEHCTAKFADNTQCCVPVFDFLHELPLCLEHARKRDNYNRMCQESKPKKPRRKPKPSAMTRSSKRSKKKKKQKQRVSRSQSLPADCITTHDSDHFEASLGAEISSSPCGSTEIYVTDDAFRIPESEWNGQSVDIKVEHIHDVSAVDVDVGVEEVLDLPLDASDLPLDASDLAEQASRLLEEHDLNNVLNQIPADAFNDLFIEDKNGEPTREETEELERALAAVDKDVKSLERMSQNHILMEDLNGKGLSKLAPGPQELLPDGSALDASALDASALDASALDPSALDPSTPAAHVFLDIEKLSQAPVLFDDKLSNAHGLLENLLDDQTLVQTLTAQLPEIPTGTNCLSSGGVLPVYYHNGYSVAAPSHSVPVYQTLQPTPNLAGSVLHTQTDLHS